VLSCRLTSERWRSMSDSLQPQSCIGVACTTWLLLSVCITTATRVSCIVCTVSGVARRRLRTCDGSWTSSATITQPTSPGRTNASQTSQRTSHTRRHSQTQQTHTALQTPTLSCQLSASPAHVASLMLRLPVPVLLLQTVRCPSRPSLLHRSSVLPPFLSPCRAGV
jgi:hypothetical protein